MQDKTFWTRLEYEASALLRSSTDCELRRFWLDGFIPEAFAKTRRGLDVKGATWVGEGPRLQHQYSFVVSVPRCQLNRQAEDIKIESLSFDHKQRLLTIVIANVTQTASFEIAPKLASIKKPAETKKKGVDR